MAEKGVVNDPPITNNYGWANAKNAGIFASYRLLHVQILEKKGLRVHGHSFPKAKILVSQNFYSFSAKFFFHYFHDIQIFINFIRLEEFDFLNLTLT